VFMCFVPATNLLADGSRHFLPVPAWPLISSGTGGGGSARGHHRGTSTTGAPSALRARGLVLVSGDVGAGHRRGASWRAGAGRSLYLPALDRHFYCTHLGSDRAGG